MLLETSDAPAYERALPTEFVRARVRSRSRDEKWGVDFKVRPAYVPLGYHVTCVPDSVYGWPLWQVRAARLQYDPGFIPIFRRMVYQTPAGGTLSFMHHGVARFDPHAKGDPTIERAPLPYGWKFERPNVVERWFEPRDRVAGSIRAKNNLPKAFVPWGDWVLRWVEETYWQASATEKMAYTDKNGDDARAASARAHAEAEAAYVNKNEFQYRKRLFESLGPDDEREVRAKTSGAYQPEAKPFVDLQGARA